MIESLLAQEVAEGMGMGLGEAARRFPPYRGARPVNPSTVFRWIHDGVRLADGQYVRLEAVRLGGRWLTSASAIERFISAQTPNLDTDPATPLQTSSQRERAATRAAIELEKLGI